LVPKNPTPGIPPSLDLIEPSWTPPKNKVDRAGKAISDPPGRDSYRTGPVKFRFAEFRGIFRAEMRSEQKRSRRKAWHSPGIHYPARGLIREDNSAARPLASIAFFVASRLPARPEEFGNNPKVLYRCGTLCYVLNVRQSGQLTAEFR
jgi:hypothetical protein